jgi:hypothetical protein
VFNWETKRLSHDGKDLQERIDIIWDHLDNNSHIPYEIRFLQVGILSMLISEMLWDGMNKRY